MLHNIWFYLLRIAKKRSAKLVCFCLAEAAQRLKEEKSASEKSNSP